MKKVILLFLLIIELIISKAENGCRVDTIKLQENEAVWAGIIREGNLMPINPGYKMDFHEDNKSNQLQPLILTSKGQYCWSEEPFSFARIGNDLIVTDPHLSVTIGKAGSSLREAHKFVSEQYFQFGGHLPDTLLFSSPQYNTWIELNFNQNQEDIIKYAEAVIENGLPSGVLMIDDTWQEDYGVWDFHPGRFPDPKAMTDRLHELGFKVMLWICPFVSADQSLLYRKLKKEKAFLLENDNGIDSWEMAEEPAMIRWWNGVSALLDFSNPVSVNWFNEQLDRLVEDYDIDGFKFDAGDMKFYPDNTLSMGGLNSNEHCESYAQFGLRFSLNEFRACWKMGGQPLAQRLQDKGHEWEDLQKLIPHMVVEGLSGYPFSCPDMIGGGLLSSFEDSSTINQELIVRSAQCHALMPMMQFSVAPWRVLDKVNFEAVKMAIELRREFMPMIMSLAHQSAKCGEPIMSNLEYYFPNQGFENIKDQFMLGSELLVAPMLTKGYSREVVLPQGIWMADDEKEYEGGRTISIEVPIDRIPYFIKLR